MAKGWRVLTKKAGFLVILCLFLPSVLALAQNNSRTRTDYYTSGGIYYTDLIGDYKTLDGGAATREMSLTDGGWTVDAGTPTYKKLEYYPGFENMSMFMQAVDTFYIKVAAANSTFLGSIGMTAIRYNTVAGFQFYSHVKSSDGTNMLLYCLDKGTKYYWSPSTAANCTVPVECELGKAYNLTWVFNSSGTVNTYVNEYPCEAYAKNGFSGGGTNTVWISDSASKNINMSIFDFYIANTPRRPASAPPLDPSPTANYVTVPSDQTYALALGQNITVNCTNNGNATVWFQDVSSGLIPKNLVSGAPNYTSYYINNTVVKDSGNYTYKGGCSYTGHTGTNTSTYNFYFIINATYVTNPANNTKNNTLGQNITAMCNSPGNVTIYFGTALNPVTPVAGGAPVNYTTLIINSSTCPADGIYYYKAACGKINGNFGYNTSTLKFTLHTGVPEVTINPNNFFKDTNYSRNSQYNNSNLLLNITLTENTDLFAFSVNITSGGVSYYEYQNNTINGTRWNHTASINQTLWPSDVEYEISIYVSDSHTAAMINKDSFIIDKTDSQLKFTVPDNKVTLVSKDAAVVDSVYDMDRFTFSFDYTKDKAYVPKTTRVYDIYSEKPMQKRNTQYKGHIVIGDARGGNWIDFENTDTMSAIVNQITPTHFQVTVNLKEPDGVVAFQSIGGLNVGHYDYKYYKGKATATSPTGVRALPFTIAIVLTKNTTITNITAEFAYNYTTYTNITEVNASNYSSFSITRPGFDLDSDQTFNYTWTLNITQGDNSKYTFYYNGQHSIYNLVLDNCTLATTPTAYFNIYNELDVDYYLDAAVEVVATYWTVKGIDDKNLTLNRGSINNFTLCLYPNSSVIYSDIYVKYAVPTGFTHRYFLVNETFNNVSKTYNLYNLNDSTGITDLKITIRKNSDYSYFQNVITKLLKRYVGENVWRVVQMDESGDYGLVFFNIQEEKQDYRLIYMDRDNHILYTSETLKFVCTTGICDLTQKLSPYSGSAATANTTVRLYYDNDTNILNVSWSKPAGLSVTQEIYITQEDYSGSRLVYNVNQTGAAGAISFNTSGEQGSFTITLREDGSQIYTAVVSDDQESLFNFLGQTEGALYTFGIMLTVIMFGLLSPAGVVITTMMGLIMIYLLGIFSPITFTFIIIAGVMGIVIGLRVRQ